MDPLGLVQGVLTPLQRARDAINGAKEVKASMRQRYTDYNSIIEPLKRKLDVVAATEIECELERLNELFTRVADLIGEYTAARTDGRLAKMNIKAKRAAYWKDVEKDLDEIDADVMRQLATMNLKGVISSSEISAEMKALLEQIKALITDMNFPSLEPIMKLLQEMRPPGLPDMAAVPAEALTLPPSYVDRAGVEEAVDALTDAEMALAPYMVVGMGGGGKTMLVSAVVRQPSVREHFRRGIFWTRVGMGAKNNLLPLLLGLARKVAQHAVPSDLDSVEKVQQYLAAMAFNNTSARALVVLDDVWEREVVDAFLSLGVKILVTTRDRSVVGVPGGLLELVDMGEEEAIDLLRKSSMAIGKPGEDVRTQMTKVVERCRRLPLLLAIAGSMPVVKGKGLKASAWEDLAKDFENEAIKMERSGGTATTQSLEVVFGASFGALAARKRKEFLKLAVLAPGAVAPIEMLLNLWEMEDTEETREEADGLANKCLIQDVGGGGYRVHDLLLDFVKLRITTKAYKGMVGEATSLQAQYLGRLDVLQSYKNPELGAGDQGLYALSSLWRTVEELSGNPELEVASYFDSLGELESCEATKEAADCFSSVIQLFYLQGKWSEAGQIAEQCQVVQEQVLGPEHEDLAETLNAQAVLMYNQGKFAKADPLLRRAIEIKEKVLGPEHPKLITPLNNRMKLMIHQGKWDEANALSLRAIEIGEKEWEKTHDPYHPDLAGWLIARADFLQAHESRKVFPGEDFAGPLYRRAIEVGEKTLGPDHPEVALWLSRLADLLSSHVCNYNREEAWPLYKRSLAIREKVFGPDNPHVSDSLHAMGWSLLNEKKNDEAIPLLERALSIRAQTLGKWHPDTMQTRKWLKEARNESGSRSGAMIAGAVGGAAMAGVVAGGLAAGGGAAVGAMVLGAASGREDGIGQAAKKAGAAVDAAVEKAHALDHEFEVSTKAKAAAGKAKQAFQKADSKFSVSQRAKETARRTVGAERAAGAAKATEKTLNQAGNAFRSLRSKAKRSFDKKKPGDS